MTVFLVKFSGGYMFDEAINSSSIQDIFDSEEKAKKYIENHEFEFVYDIETEHWYYYDEYLQLEYYAWIEKWGVK